MQRKLPAAALAAALLASCGGDDTYGPCIGCFALAVQFKGTVSGLASGTSLQLGDTSGITTSLASNGSFSYLAYPAPGVQPLIGVLVQPAGQACTVSYETSGMSGVVSVDIACNALPSPAPVMLALYAGTLAPGAADATGSAALFNGPSALATDSSGNVYVADTFNNTIRKISAGGVVTTLAGAAGFAGAADGTGAAARFNGPGAVATDAAGNVYVADTFNNTIRKITPAGVVTTIAGAAGSAGSANGTGTAARFDLPLGIAANSAGTIIYVSDFNNSTIRELTSAGVVTTLAGTAGVYGSANGTGAAASFNGPQGMALDASGNIYVADTYNDEIREVTPAGVVSTLAGTPGVAGAANGAATAATFNLPLDVVLDGSGDVFVADNGNSLIREISGGVVSTAAGTVGQDVFSAGALPGSLQNPTSLALFGTTLYVTTINAVADIDF